tara:strand:+ start:2493 stop:2993 length:501 start_codon:yes stop_codon:yes gene_type:complete
MNNWKNYILDWQKKKRASKIAFFFSTMILIGGCASDDDLSQSSNAGYTPITTNFSLEFEGQVQAIYTDFPAENNYYTDTFKIIGLSENYVQILMDSSTSIVCQAFGDVDDIDFSNPQSATGDFTGAATFDGWYESELGKTEFELLGYYPPGGVFEIKVKGTVIETP